MPDRSRSSPQDLNANPGFTLIELLIVIVILGILAGIVVFAVGTAREDSVQSACEADAKTVRVATEAFKAETGNTADDFSDIVPAYMKQNPNTGNADYQVSLAGVCTVS